MHIEPFLTYLNQFSTIWIGLSGGMDSMVLLHQIAQYPHLKNKSRAIHVHHGISTNADAWLNFCFQQTKALAIPLVYEKVQVSSKSNIEALARDLRYGVYQKYVENEDVLILGHHFDDQIETFFLNILRGSGLDGLSVMSMMKLHMGMCLFRPLLNTPRHELESYAQYHQLEWIEDESNENTKFARNYLRHEVLPKIHGYWPHYRTSLKKTLSHCQAAQDCLEEDILKEYPQLIQMPVYLDCRLLKKLPIFKVGMIIRAWLKQKNFPRPGYDVLQEVYHQMVMQERVDSNPCIRWGKIVLHVYQQRLYVVAESKIITSNQAWNSFPNKIRLETGQILYAKNEIQGFQYHDKDSVEIRFRRGGEKFYWKRHHRCLKKLFQEWKVPPFLRDSIPLIYVNGVLKQVVGYACEFEDDSHQKLYQVMGEML